MSPPAVTVVVPTRDRPRQLGDCLAALAALDHPADRLEVVVVDDGGTSDLAPALGRVRDRVGVRVLRQAQAGAGSARNTGAAAAEGEALAFTDDDCVPDPGWLRALLAELARRPEALVGGWTVNALPANPFAATSQRVQDLVYAHYNADPARARFLASNNLAAGRAPFRALGGFDPVSFPVAAEDRDLCDRWRAAGRPLVLARDALVWHAHELSLRGFCRQHVAYGRGAARFHAARRARGSGRLRDELAFHADAALWHELLDATAPRRSALLALWQLSNALGYAAERASALAPLRRLARARTAASA